MKFLVPSFGNVAGYGHLITHRRNGVPAGVTAGRPWAADNCVFTGAFDGDRFLAWLAALEKYRASCLFVVVPDVVGDAAATLAAFAEWAPKLSGWPLAFVAQDGQENLEFPPAAAWSALFVGGSTDWKLSAAAVSCIRRAESIGKHIHIGRVNYRRRYDAFRLLAGSDSWTCDGTRPRFEGVDRALRAWAGYENQGVLIHLDK